MNFDYDENLSANPFYRTLQLHHEVLLQAAAQENWVICVPRAGYFGRTATTSFSNDFILRHILQQNSDLGCHYTNLLGHNVILDNRRVILVTPTRAAAVGGAGGGSRAQRSAAILFEEIIYRTDSLTSCGLSKFKLWCLDKPILVDDPLLGGADAEAAAMAEPIQYQQITTFEEAEKFLDSEFVKSKCILQRAQKICQEFVNGSPRRFPTMESLHESTKVLLNRIWTGLLSANFYVKKLCKEDVNYSKMLKMAVENYASQFIHRFILDRIAALEPSHCEQLNRKIVNLSADDLTNPGRDLATNIIGLKLSQIDGRGTVYDKLSLLREVLKAIHTSSDSPMSSDEMLTILVEAIIRGKSLHWHQNLVFMKRFKFTECDNESSELSYLVTTLEAALQCILEKKLFNETRFTKLLRLEGDSQRDLEIPTFENKSGFLEFLFNRIEECDEEVVLQMVNLLTSEDQLKEKLMHKDLCHPLCGCSECQLRIIADTPTIDSPNERTGDSCVHLVAKFGLVNVMRRILAETSDLDVHRLRNGVGETPLHVAGKYGQQNILLLLLHSDHGVNLNLVDGKGNTVLHLATKMGHLNCVKALLYFAEHKQLRALQVNAKNNSGDTSLHLAAKAGFLGIVETLLEFTASKTVKNNLGKAPADVAFSSAIQEIIRADSWDRVVAVHQMKGSQNKLDPKQVELVNKAIERGDVNLVLHFLKINQERSSSSQELDIIADLDTEDRINSCTADGIYPIHVAMRVNNLELVKVLVKFNVEFDVKTKDKGETPFHLAAHNQTCESVKYIFDNVPHLDAILNEANVEGNTVLHLAVKERNLKLVHMLLKFNVNYELVNQENKDAIGLAREMGLNDLADYMEYVKVHAERKNSSEGASSSSGHTTESSTAESR